jgi:putative transposase
LASSAADHFAIRDDALVAVHPRLDVVPYWEAFIGGSENERFNELLRGHASSGRPLGSDTFVESLERPLSRSLKRKKPGPTS